LLSWSSGAETLLRVMYSSSKAPELEPLLVTVILLCLSVRTTMMLAGTLPEASESVSQPDYTLSQPCQIFDPKRTRYGSKVVFPDRACPAIDTGPAVASRKAARLCGRTASQLKAIVVDRFFETKREAIAWTNAHPDFMTLQIVRPGSDSEPSEL